MASEPFDATDADIILRTSDNVYFHVYKVILSVASPYFKTMFSLPQGGSRAQQDQPVIDVEEDSRTIDDLLRLCYPVDDPVNLTDDFARVAKVVAAAVKYDLKEATTLMKTALSNFIPSVPLRVYAITCRLSPNLDDLLISAAKQWREMNQTNTQTSFEVFEKALAGRSYVDEMDHHQFSAGDYYRLLRFISSGNESDLSIPSSAQPDSDSTNVTPQPRVAFGSQNDDILCIWRHYLAKKSQKTVEGGISIIQLDEDSDTVAAILKICYHIPMDTGTSLDLVYKVWLTTRKYGMSKLQNWARQAWKNRMSESPMKAYLIALHHRWEEEARETAQILLAGKVIDKLYVKEMEESPARRYYNLLKYVHECSRLRIAPYGAFMPDLLDKEHPGRGYVTIASPIVKRELENLHQAIQNYAYDYYDSGCSTGDIQKEISSIINESGDLERRAQQAMHQVVLEIA
ncbi:hypothetical protein C8Q75DRAFT_807410 [Abortiporus biennis]|nr:hypothetical protein C8Q75DRAFT_807410 [Abortiporus biennis]